MKTTDDFYQRVADLFYAAMPPDNYWHTLRPKTMPSKSARQHRYMEAIAHNAKFAKKAGVPQKVAREFVAADKRKKRR